MAKVLISIFLFVNFVFGASATDFFDFSSESFKEDMQSAKDDGKQGIMIFFGMDDCPFCHKMKINVLNQPDVMKYYKENFASYEVDVNGDIKIKDFDGTPTTHKQFAIKHNVRATPVIAFFDLDGNKIFTRTGYSSKDEFLLLGDFIATKKYQTLNFTKYKREKLEK
ncbi:MAG: thioredoxin fold domain-containing protein [Arcobacter sp.]|nr:thioredoxin fold domain-containing protein [Arcobacter sp.]